MAEAVAGARRATAPDPEAKRLAEADTTRWLAAGFPARHRRDVDQLAEPKHAAQLYPHFADGGCVLLVGPAGTGKTLTAAFLCRRMTTQDRKPATYIRWEELAERMRREFGDDGKEEGTELRRVERTHALVIDDFHLDDRSPWQLIQATRLIDYRWANVKPTIFISNLTTAAMEQQFGQANMSRITGEWAKVVEAKGPDRRKGQGAA